tara:strand:+ start:132 stop:560 length:429 start_codon:yes stop_codon:yes gene_type:complete
MIFNFLKNNKKDESDDTLFTKIGSLLIHIAKIDENYTDKEKEIISKTLLELGAERENLDQIILDAEKKENDSNQILEFTKDIKTMDKKGKEKIVEALWSVVYSDGSADMYEENLMRRLSGLLYLDKKIVGDIKEKIKSEAHK